MVPLANGPLIGEGDVAACPFSIGILLRSLMFWVACTGLVMLVTLGLVEFPIIELLIFFERWAGERLVVEGAVPFARRVERPNSVSAVPVGPGIDIGRSCRFLGSVVQVSCCATRWVVSVFALS